MVGPACARTDGYYYYWLDDLILEESAKFDSLFLSVQGNPCVDSIQLSSPPTKITRITYQWYFNGVAIAGASNPNYLIPKGQVGKYILRAADGADCELSNNYNYTIDTLSSSISQQICNGEKFKVGSNEFTMQGLYRVVIPSANGCDSIVHLDLKVITPGQGFLDTAICENEVLDLNGVIYDTTGLYQINSNTELGCDSVSFLRLKVKKTFNNDLNVSICEGENFIIGQDTFSVNGDYPLYYISKNQCDSTVTIHLAVNTSVSQLIDTSICQGEFLQSGNVTLDKAGTYYQSLKKMDGCDSLVTLNLKVNPAYFTGIDTSFCEGNHLIIGNQNFDSTGIYFLHLKTTNACDSNFQIKLNVLPTHQLNFTNTICEGQSYDFAGKTFNTTGIYQVVLKNRFGCDSILTLDLKVNSSYDTNLDTSICDNSSIKIGAINYSKAGNYSQHLSSINLCDSIVHINLSNNKSYQKLVDTSICKGYAIAIGNQNYDKSGSFNIGLKTIEGCDSSIVLNLNVKPNYNSRLDTVICFDGQIVIDGKTYVDEADFNLQYISLDGCDSTLSVRIKKTSLPDIQIDKQTIRCFGDKTGAIKVTVNGNYGPYKYNWNTGQSASELNQLATGNYIVSIRDNKNCLIEKTISIPSPPQLLFSLDKKNANCLDPNKGSIIIKAVSGGVPPYKYSIDGIPVSFAALKEIATIGNHDVVMIDSNGCEVKYQINIDPAKRGNIDLQSDSLSVILGDSVYLDVLTNNIDSIASIDWTGPGYISCKTCLKTSAFISSFSGNFKIIITDNNGCIYEESIYVKSKQNYYAPNVFSPNGDNINDYFNIITDRSIDNVEVLHIYDRWGNQVYESLNFPPNGIGGAWNGDVGSQKALPGVYVYLFLFKDKAGISHKLSGDLTLVR